MLVAGPVSSASQPEPTSQENTPDGSLPFVEQPDEPGVEGAASVRPLRRYVAEGLPILVDVGRAAELARVSGRSLEFDLYEGDRRAASASADVRLDRRRPDVVDLSRLFPRLWSAPEAATEESAVAWTSAYSVQAVLTDGGGAREAIGPPVVVAGLLTRPPTRDALSAGLRRAALAGDARALSTLHNLDPSSKRRLSTTPAPGDPSQTVRSGVLVVVQRDVVFSTSLGELRIALRYDAAPMTAQHVADLVAGGLYDGTIIHRVIAKNERGLPFLIQFGDPTGTGMGDGGVYTPFEPSRLLHDFGTVSIAHPPGRFDQNGSQLMLCLGRDAGSALDGLYTVFAEVVDGAPTIGSIEAVPTEAFDPFASPAPTHRPIEPPVISSARLVASPPVTERLSRVQREESPPVVR